jgi:YD repeat-containing protein
MIDPTNADPTAIPLGYTRDVNGRVLSYRDKRGYWCATYDDAGRVLTYRDSDGCREDYAYDVAGKCTITRTQEAA